MIAPGNDVATSVGVPFSDAASNVLQKAGSWAAAVVDAIREVAIVLDASLGVVKVNRAFFDIFEKEAAVIQGESVFAIDRGALDIPALRTALDGALASKTPSELDIRPALPRIGERVMRVRVCPLRTEDDRPHLILLVIEDITERKWREEALAESESRMRAIFDGAADGIITTDPDGFTTTWNRAAERIFGYSADEARGMNVTILMPETHLARIGQTSREVVGRRKDGTTVPLDLAVNEFHDGKCSGFIGIVRDITRRKRAEHDARQHQLELARVLRVSLVGELGASLAHEVLQPLAAIASTLEACAMEIRAGNVVPKDLLGLVDRAIEQSLRAGEIVRNLRELVRGQPSQKEEVDLRRLIDSAVLLVTGELEEDHIGVQLALGDEPLPVLVTSIELEQVILNILQNAIDAILERGDPWREIAISASKNTDTNSVEVAVRDNGIGIRSSSMEKLFKPFFSTKRSGIGLGLAICRSIVEGHGGRLWVAPGEHDPGATTIRFILPLASRATPPRTPTRFRR